jgi:hypothetical protein
MIGRGGAGLIILNGEYYIIGNKNNFIFDLSKFAACSKTP